jgi:hypothetical protein
MELNFTISLHSEAGTGPVPIGVGAAAGCRCQLLVPAVAGSKANLKFTI